MLSQCFLRSHLRKTLWSAVMVVSLIGLGFYGCSDGSNSFVPSESSCKTTRQTTYYFDGRCVSEREYDVKMSSQCKSSQKYNKTSKICEASKSNLADKKTPQEPNFGVSYEDGDFVFTGIDIPSNEDEEFTLKLRILDGRDVEVNSNDLWVLKEGESDKYLGSMSVGNNVEEWNVEIEVSVSKDDQTATLSVKEDADRDGSFTFADNSLYDVIDDLGSLDRDDFLRDRLVGLEFSVNDLKLTKKDQVIHGQGLQYLLSKYKRPEEDDEEEKKPLFVSAPIKGSKDVLEKQLEALVKAINRKVADDEE
ncbi:MAG: hypothetical protein OXC44_02505 [Proteobacteria bacterium]|nr:hypothetical protein [Pseudomonadota bacterium]